MLTRPLSIAAGLLATAAIGYGVGSSAAQTTPEVGYCPSLPNPVVCTVLVPWEGASTPIPPAGSPTPTPAPETPPVTATEVRTPTPEVAPTIPASAANLLVNPGLNFSVSMPFQETSFRKVMAWGWKPFECNQCDALRRGTGNPLYEKMGSPEYQPAAYRGTPGREWVEGNNGQTWYVPWQTYQAGVFQTVTVPAGAQCVAGAMVRSWSTPQSSFTSQLETADDKLNSTWNLWVDPYGGTDWRASRVLVSRGFGFDDGIYDNYAPVSFAFKVPTTSTRVTLFIGDTRLWPFGNQQSYVDAAYLRCN